MRSAQVRARAAESGTSSTGDPMTTCNLMLRGPVGADPDGLLTALMTALASHTGLQVQHGDPRNELPAHRWLEVRDGDGVWSGNARVQFESHADILTFSRPHRSGVVELDGELRALDLQNPLLAANGELLLPADPLRHRARTWGNGRGKRRGRGPCNPLSTCPLC